VHCNLSDSSLALVACEEVRACPSMEPSSSSSSSSSSRSSGFPRTMWLRNLTPVDSTAEGGTEENEVAILSKSAIAPDDGNRKRKTGGGMSEIDLTELDEVSLSTSRKRAKVLQRFSALTYNVWFNEEVALLERVQAIVEVIEGEKPTFLALQEMTPLILKLMAGPLKAMGYNAKVQNGMQQSYFTVLCSRLPWLFCRETDFANSIMSRGLLYGAVKFPNGQKTIVGTTHLESAIPPFYGDARKSNERKLQLLECFKTLDSVFTSENASACILLGDLNWDEGDRPYKKDPRKRTFTKDGQMRLPEGWRDAWTTKFPGASFEEGCTYNSRANPMLRGSFAFRPDRILFKGIYSACPVDVRIVGTSLIKDVTYQEPRSGKNLPVLPSDHFGLICNF